MGVDTVCFSAGPFWEVGISDFKVERGGGWGGAVLEVAPPGVPAALCIPLSVALYFARIASLSARLLARTSSIGGGVAASSSSSSSCFNFQRLRLRAAAAWRARLARTRTHRVWGRADVLTF